MREEHVVDEREVVTQVGERVGIEGVW